MGRMVHWTTWYWIFLFECGRAVEFVKGNAHSRDWASMQIRAMLVAEASQRGWSERSKGGWYYMTVLIRFF